MKRNITLPIASPLNNAIGQRNEESEDRFGDDGQVHELGDAAPHEPGGQVVGSHPEQPTGRIPVQRRKVVVLDILSSDPRYKTGMKVEIRDPVANSEVGLFADRPAAVVYMGNNDLYE